MPPSDPDGDHESKPRDTSFEEKVEGLAQKLLRSDENGFDPDDIEGARKAARRMLEDSEERTTQATDLDPDDDDVIRRSSGESAASGDTGPMRTVSDGD